MHKFCTAVAVFLLLPLAPTSPPLAAEASEGTSPPREEAPVAAGLWEGSVEVRSALTVAPGTTLTIAPGTVVRFENGTGLTVQGNLVARGTPEAPIVFTAASPDAAPGTWDGLHLAADRGETVLTRCRIEYAKALVIGTGAVSVEECLLEKGLKGMDIAMEASPRIQGNRIRDMAEGGIECRLKSSPLLRSNEIARCGPFGIAVSQGATPRVVGNRVENCAVGLGIMGEIPPVEGNTFESNGSGIGVSHAGGNLALRRNSIRGGTIGIDCRDFASPVIEENVVASAEVGVLCFRSSSPLIARNRIAGNQEGLRCVQMSNPVVTENVFEGNGTAVFLHLSSYAVIRRNNLAGNETHIHLDNMSSDWERRVGKKPIRGRQAQNRNLVNLGRAVPQDYQDDAVTEGYVDARENWWGDAVTAEMERVGPDGNIASIQDYHDVPVRIYEGDPEEYVQDRVNFSDWLRQKVETAGPSVGATQEGKE